MKLSIQSAAFYFLALLLCSWFPAQAASVTLQITDAAGWPSTDAVAYLEAAGGQSLPKRAQSVQIEQRARKFFPVVTVIQTGTAISFPNHDTVRHQVYSFSTPKVFELKLYSGAGGDPIVFDKPGTVVVGCNIHDQMAAFIQIVDTPFFGKTDAAGKVVIDNIQTGKYNLRVWHPNMPTSVTMPAQPVTVANSDQALPILLTFKTEKK